MPEDPPLTAGQVAALLGVSVKTVYRRVAAGEIRTIGENGRYHIRVTRDEVERLLNPGPTAA